MTIINRVAHDARLAAHDARLAAHALANTRHHLTGSSQPSAPTLENASAGDPMEQLAKLGQLRDAGVLTDDEFAAKKVEILARM
ncbi:SHOCT domain-containing protein [Rhodococcus spelaei]|nr:SHOCT domain-containing protein [Rhodococcus spelaei]